MSPFIFRKSQGIKDSKVLSVSGVIMSIRPPRIVLEIKHFQFRIPPMLVRKYVDENNLAVMLGMNSSADVRPEVNLRECTSYILLYQMQIRLSTLVLKPRGDVTRSPKQGYQWPHKRTCVQQKLFKNMWTCNTLGRSQIVDKVHLHIKHRALI